MRSVASTLPIGVFDSGVGGLTVWRELRKQLPDESFLYLGDTIRLPYGGRPSSEIVHGVREIVNWMLQQPVKAIVMACNTSSALALELVRQECPVPILGLILPGARAAVRQGKRIGVISTEATANSHAYRNAILEINSDLQCWEIACPNFVPLIESGHLDSPELRHAVERYIRPLIDCSIDTIVSGCTHYPLIERAIRRALPMHVNWVDPADSLATAVAQELDFLGLRAHSSLGRTRFCVSGNDADRFADLAANWIHPIPHGHRIKVEAVQLSSVSQEPAAVELRKRVD